MDAESQTGFRFCKIFIRHETSPKRYYRVSLSAGGGKMSEGFTGVEGNHIPQQGNLKSHPPCVGETRNQF